MRRFPIVHIPKASHKEPGAPGFDIPWSMAEKAHATYVKLLGNVQTLERLAERGGFEWFEFVMLYCGEGVAWAEAKYLDKELIRHCTQRVVADLLAWKEKERQPRRGRMEGRL